MEQTQKDFYKLLVKNGVPKEDARMYIGMGMSTEVYFACNFRELRHILKLRLDKHAQAEIRKLARGVYDICAERWPWILEGISSD
jgi:thymidylate synthase (FAD)